MINPKYAPWEADLLLSGVKNAERVDLKDLIKGDRVLVCIIRNGEFFEMRIANVESINTDMYRKVKIGARTYVVPKDTYQEYAFFLLHREKPALPTEDGALIEVTRINGEEITPALMQFNERKNRWYTFTRVGGRYDRDAFSPREVTEWEPRKVVAA